MNIGYHSAILQGRMVRTLYSKMLPILARRPIEQNSHVPVSVYSFSCHRDLPEQVASIRSFIRYVGVPEQFIVVSDGSYTNDDAILLSSVAPCVRLLPYEEVVAQELPPAVEAFARFSPYGKKLAVAFSLPVDGATIMTDADVLFFQGADMLTKLILDQDRCIKYLLDVQPALDNRMISNSNQQKNPVNCGFMLLKEHLNWDASLKRLAGLQGLPIPFTEQTVVHFAMHDSDARPFCRNKFVLELDDQVHYTDWYAHKDIAMRHYVNPVRHKMWFRLPS